MTSMRTHKNKCVGSVESQVSIKNFIFIVGYLLSSYTFHATQLMPKFGFNAL